MMTWMCDCGSWIIVESAENSKVSCSVCNRDWHLYPMMIPKSHCWKFGCQRNDIFRIGRGDGSYGHHCSICGESLRSHPFFGEGKEYDIGDSIKWFEWNKLSKFDRSLVYKRYGFK